MKLLSLLVLAFALLLSYNVAATTPALSTTLSLWDSFMSIISMIVPGIVPTPATSDVPIDFGSPIIQKNLDDEKDSDSAVGPLLDEAKKLIQTGTMDQTVVGILLNALEVNPDHQEANYLAGTALLALSRPSEAQIFLYKAVSVSNWTEHNSIANLAEALRLTGDLELATKVAQKGISQFENSDPSGMLSFTIGSIFQTQKAYKAASDWFLSSALKQPSNVDLWIRASTLQFPEEGVDLNFAQNVLIQAIQAIPQNSQLYLYMGYAMQRSGRLEEAVTFYQENIRLDGSSFDAVANMATTLHTLGRHSEALRYYDAAYQASPTNSIVCASFANLLAVIGQHGRALSVLDTSLAADPSNELLLSTKASVNEIVASSSDFKAQVLRVQSAITEAVQASDWDRVVSIAVDYGEPKDGAVWWYFAVGMAMIFKGEHKTGYDLCKRAEASEPKSHIVHACIAVAAKALGNTDMSAHHFEKSYEILTTNPSNILPFPDLGFYASKEEMELGVISSLHDNGKYDRCLLWSLELMKLPSLTEGGIFILYLSLLQWTQSMIDRLPDAEYHSRNNAMLSGLQIERTLLQEIERLVVNHRDLLQYAGLCLEKTTDESTRRAKASAMSVSEFLMSAN